MSNRLEEAMKDVAELRTIVALATRKRVQDILAEELRKMELEVSRLQEEVVSNTEPSKPKENSNKIYTIKIRNYSWDESDKFVKLYITLKNVQSLAKEKVVSSFGDRSVQLMVQELDGKNHQLSIGNLAGVTKPDTSHHKVKTDMVVLFLAKTEPRKWGGITAEEVLLAESRKPKANADDPNAGMMDLMKQMYLDGDDKMKQMLNKTWYESQQKTLRGEGGGMTMPGMGGGMPGMGGGMAGMPGMGGMAGMPGMGGMAGMPGMGGMAGMPGMGGMAGMPDMSSMAGMAGMPDMSSMAGMPGMGGMGMGDI